MPCRMVDSGVYRDIVHPIGAEVRQTFEQAILKAYASCVSEKEIPA
ncbi:MAG: septation protein SpoVG family protein [Oscillospiraceae bacterium]